jgi:hypothetical protein
MAENADRARELTILACSTSMSDTPKYSTKVESIVGDRSIHIDL